MKSLFRLSAGLILSVSVITSAAANDHKILGVIAMPRNETNELTLKLPVCRVVKRIQLSAERGDIQLSGATVYFKASHTLNVPAGIKEGNTTGWITLNSDNDNKRCVKKIAFSGQTVNSSDMASLKIIGDD
ncbi:DUF2541 family protein [Klebsiella quasipneumoniae]|uniref:DUF2541 family protein n=1 Tax=Klebsiella quasipneumoniae TaxID=1463165 RepID=UPI0024B09EA4|nr:DUF2541 family protein [Klebsiella quasipneumoniae]MDI9090327.1 DUF2541 family protein [Klebsiella quasipneumoniae subsp. similipneumoniae]HEN5009901.1 DUF2541 family protein [Klebsiella quasipneumoniae subsp. similipneumoniae]HEN5290074.1 DUF2541 family protein [Klebsiella quasipneumoniae subsp. similipneumoniae]HEO0726081.1 DUF2541 family protein [Klebsiella quasipneumoniae subsp. similipneumoniae]